MKKLLRILPLFVLLSKFSGAQSTPCKEVVGYMPDWQWYDRNHLVNPISIDYSQYTVINYCFFQPMANGTIALGDSWAEQNLLQGQIDWNTNQYLPNTSIVDRAHNAGVKVLVSIGGWTWSTNFPAIAADPQKRANFAHDCNHYVSFYNLDGIDIDWEYPANSTESNGFTTLLQQIRDSLDALEIQSGEQYLLSAAVGASSAHMSNVQWSNVVPLLDMINLMSYDFFGAWDPVANHNSPLNASACGDPNFNVSSAFSLLTGTYGVPTNKVNIGIAFYGRTQNGYNGLCQTASGNSATTAFPPDGTPMYYDIAAQIGQYTQHWDNAAQVPYLSGNSNSVFVSYDNEQSLALKAQYVNAHNARGVIIWEITGDYLETSAGSGVIAGTPLIDTVNAVLCSGITANNEIRNEFEFSLSPNPAQDQVSIRLNNNSAGAVGVVLTDLPGKVLRSQKTISISGGIQVLNMNTADLPAGTYFCTLVSEHSRSTQKLIITR